eukprot:scaffold120359_cov60-Phaeocystis_antarctica.AAC.2
MEDSADGGSYPVDVPAAVLRTKYTTTTVPAERLWDTNTLGLYQLNLRCRWLTLQNLTDCPRTRRSYPAIAVNENRMRRSPVIAQSLGVGPGA